MISGCQDLAGIFHSFGYCMTSNEDTDSYSFLMASLKDVASKMKLTFDINFLMNDGSKAAIAAGRQNFSNYTQLMCRFHVKYNIQNEITKDYPEINEETRSETYKKINSGIKMLEIASTNL